jgi:tRNA dimethylallyltransferase
MLAEGLLIETQQLLPYKQLNALQTVGYRELFDFWEGKHPLLFAIEEIKKNTRRFAKRQYTWFNRDERIQWFDYQTPIEEIIKKTIYNGENI